MPRTVIGKDGNIGINELPSGENVFVYDRDDVANIALKGGGNLFDYSAISLMSDGQALDRAYNLVHNKSNEFLFIYNDGTDLYPRMHFDTLGHISLNNWEAGTEVFGI